MRLNVVSIETRQELNKSPSGSFPYLFAKAKGQESIVSKRTHRETLKILTFTLTKFASTDEKHNPQI